MRMQRYCLLGLYCVLFVVSAVSHVLAQSNVDLDPATRHAMESAAAQGFPLPSSLVIAGVGTATQAPAAATPPAAKKSAKSGKGQKGSSTTPAQTSTPAAATQGAGTESNNSASTPAKTTGKSTDTTRGTANAGNVIDNASVQSVLLPYEVCKRVFGKEVATHYAAVELTVSNRSSSASLILHSIFIDYSRWALSGSMYIPPLYGTAQAGGSGNGSKPGNTSSGYPPYEVPNDPNQVASVEYRVVRGEALDAQPWTARNWIMRSLDLAGAIATAYSFSINEQGIIRGIGAFTGQVTPAAKAFIPDNTVDQLNRISDLAFQVNKVIPKNSSDIVVAFFPIDRFLTPGLKKIYLKSPALFFAPYALVLDTSARAALVPIVAKLMPPNVHCSNGPTGSPEPKCTPTKAADQFLSELATQYMFDVAKQSESDIAKADQNNAQQTTSESSTSETSQGAGQKADNKPAQSADTGAPPSPTDTQTNPPSPSTNSQKSKAVNPVEALCADLPNSIDLNHPAENPLSARQTCYIKKFLANASLNTVHIVIGGEMTVDITKVPATITSIDMDNGNDSADTWKASTQTGVIHGSFLTSGTPDIKEAKDLGITDIKAVSTGSSDTELHFTMTLSKAIPASTKLTFTVTKTDNAGNQVNSMPFVLTTDGTSSKSQVTGAQVKNSVVTLSGSGFPTAKPDSITIALHSDIAKPSDYTLDSKAFTVPNASEVDIKLAGLTDKDGKAVSLAASCWTVKATVDGTALDGEPAFPIFPETPTVTSAKVSSDSKTVDVIGTNFVDLAGCDNRLVFKLLNNSTGTPQGVTGLKPKSATEVVFDYPATPSGVTWNVLVGYRDATGKGVAVTK